MSLALHPFQEAWSTQAQKILEGNYFYLDCSPPRCGKRYVALSVACARQSPVLIITEQVMLKSWKAPLAEAQVDYICTTYPSLTGMTPMGDGYLSRVVGAPHYQITPELLTLIEQGVLIIFDSVSPYIRPRSPTTHAIRAVMHAIENSKSQKSRVALLYGQPLSEDRCPALLYSLGIISSPVVTYPNPSCLEEMISYCFALHREMTSQVVSRRKMSSVSDVTNVLYQLYVYVLHSRVTGKMTPE